jgi:hypothetical protein
MSNCRTELLGFANGRNVEAYRMQIGPMPRLKGPVWDANRSESWVLNGPRELVDEAE